MNVTFATVELGEAGLFGLTLKTDKLNKRAERYGMNKLVVTVVREFTVVCKKTGCELIRYDVEIEGSAPCINGWYLGARIENNALIGTNVRIVPGRFEDDDYSEYRAYDFSRDVCDHCNTCRRRNDVYVLVNDGGCRKVIGRVCLGDYLRCDNAEDFARYAEFVDSCGSFTDEGLSEFAYESEFGGRGNRPAVELERFLSVVQCCSRRLGWVGRSTAFDNPGLSATADDAYFVLFGGGRHHAEFIESNELYVSDGDKDLAGLATEWVQSLEEDKSEYMETLRKIGIAGFINESLAGYAASIIGAYQREAERAEKSKDDKEKDYLGEVGKTADRGVVTIVGVNYSEGEYGTTTIVRMKADLPNGKEARVVWFASGSKEFEVGAQYDLRAGIKDTNNHPKYGKQSVITRAKLTRV